MKMEHIYTSTFSQIVHIQCEHISGGSKGGAPSACLPPLPTAQNFCKFMHFFEKFWQNHRLGAPSWRVGAPSYGEYWIRHCTSLNNNTMHVLP